jgi:myosin heavy subunit
MMNNIKEIDDLYNGFAQEREQLGEIIRLLSTKTQSFLDGLTKEIKAIDDKFSGKIEKETIALEKTKSILNKAYSEKVTAVSSKFEQETVALNKEIIMLEKSIQEINTEIEQVETEIKNALINKDEQSEQQLKEKRNELKKKTPELNQTIKSYKEKIQELDDNKKNELFQLRQENEAEVKEASKDLLEVVVARDAEKKICQDEMQKLEELSSKISSDVDKLSKMMDTALNAFNNLGIKKGAMPPLLVHMPFYLLSYFSNSDTRFSYIAPSIVNSMAISVRLKAIGKKKITQMFQPRSPKIESILNKFILLLNENVPFRHEITDACTKADMLKSKETVMLIKNGLADLKSAGWISDEEYESYSQLLS